MIGLAYRSAARAWLDESRGHKIWHRVWEVFFLLCGLCYCLQLQWLLVGDGQVIDCGGGFAPPVKSYGSL